jgi:hypothetical protein
MEGYGLPTDGAVVAVGSLKLFCNYVTPKEWGLWD